MDLGNSEPFDASGFVPYEPPGFGRSRLMAANDEPNGSNEELDQETTQDQPSGSGSSSASTGTTTSSPGTYFDMFPSLPTSTKPKTTQTTPWASNATKKTRNSSETLTIIAEQVRASGFGDKSHSEICKNVMNETDTVVEVTRSKNGSMNVLITGKPENIQMAKKKLLSSLSKQYEIKVAVPQDYVSVLIGKAGSNLKTLQEKTGAKLNVPKGEEFVLISGDRAAVENARLQVKAFLDEKMNFVKETFLIEEQYQRFVYGQNNENIKRISTETGAKIHIPPSDSTEKELTLLGQREQVAQALKEIQNIYAEKKRTTKSITVSVNKKQHRFIIGPKGANLAEIFQVTGCHVQIPPLTTPSENVVVFGEESQILNALKMILDKAASVALEEIAIDGAPLKRFMKLKGKYAIKDLEKGKQGVFINVGPNSIDIEGQKEEVEAARKEVLDILAQYKKLKLEEITIEPELRKFVIGKNGQTLKKIKTEHNVDVMFPQDDETVETILLAGEKSKVNIVKEFINKTTKEMAKMATIEFKADPRFYKNILGKQGENIKKLNEEYEKVSIKIPKPDEASDIIVLRGPKDDIEKLKAHLQQIVEDARHYEIMHNYTDEIVVQKKVIKYIVGKAGASINRFKEQFDVRIEIEPDKTEKTEETPSQPETKEKSRSKGFEKVEKDDKKGKEGKEGKEDKEETGVTKITIQGLKKNVEAAKAALAEKAKEFAEGGGMTTIELKIDPRYYGKLKGPQGKFVTSLVDRYSVNINFPPQGTDSDIIVIKGMKKSAEKARTELLDLLEYEKSVGHVAEIIADNEVLKQVMGVGHSNSKTRFLQICHGTATTIDFDNNDFNSNKLLIRGTEKNIAEAKKLLQDYINELKNSQEVEIDPRHYKNLIGYKGVKIHEISEKYGVQVKFPSEGEGKLVKIYGSPEGIEGAKAYLLDFVKQASENQKTNIVEETFPFPNTYRIREASKVIADELGVKIYFPKSNDSQEKQNLVVIKGAPNDIKKALELLKENIEEEKTVEIPRNLHKAMITSGKIRELSILYNAQINIPNQQSTSTTVKITGKPTILADLEKALLDLAEEVKDKEPVANQPTSKEDRASIPFKKEHIGRVMGKKGSIIKNISDISGAKIDVDKEKGILNIRGSKDAVSFAKEEFLDIINGIEQQHTEVIQISPKYYSHIRANELDEIQKDFMVMVNLPRNEGSDVTIQGLKDDCLSAAEYLLTVAKELELDNSFRAERPKPVAQKSSGHKKDFKNDAFFAPPPQSSSNSSNSSTGTAWGPKSLSS